MSPGRPLNIKSDETWVNTALEVPGVETFVKGDIITRCNPPRKKNQNGPKGPGCFIFLFRFGHSS
ncbi:hypothetical protein EBR03_03690 [bacterium]|nr:hypothetical protein [bacterium]